MFKTVILMKVNMNLTRSVGSVNSPGKVETSIKAVIKVMNAMVTEKCTGLMALVTRANGTMESKMEWAAWSSPMAV